MKSFFIIRLKKWATQLAIRLTRSTDRLSPAGKIAGLILFTLLSSSLSGYIVWSTLGAAALPPTRFVVKPSKIPRHIGKSIGPDNHALISKALYDRIEAVKQNDSLMRAHPQLLDSIHAFEQSYQSQSKNK